ncbi:MAG: DKNYY domain-containing protein [bacterium]
MKNKIVTRITVLTASIGICLSALAFDQAYAATQKKPGNEQPLRALNYRALWLKEEASIPQNTDEYYNLKPGMEFTVTVSFKNIGTEVWHSDGEDRQVCISTYKDPQVQSARPEYGFDLPNSGNFGKSMFKSNTWKTDYRAACLDQNSVAPGEVGTFTLKFSVPIYTFSPPSYWNANGIWRDDFSLSSGPFWIEADAPYPQGKGDPLGIAHLWVGFRVEDQNPKTPKQDTTLLVQYSKCNSYTGPDEYEKFFINLTIKNKQVYLGDDVILAQADATTFHFITDQIVTKNNYISHDIVTASRRYAVDAKAMYFISQGESWCSDIHTKELVVRKMLGVAEKSFRVMENDYARDALHIYFQGMPLAEVDLNAAQLLSYPYLKDKSCVYFQNKKVIGADPNTFEVLGDGYAKDKNHYYLRENITLYLPTLH